MAKFITKDDGIDCYPDQVQYFFKHTINLLMMDLKNIFWHIFDGTNIQALEAFDIISAVIMITILVM